MNALHSGNTEIKRQYNTTIYSKFSWSTWHHFKRKLSTMQVNEVALRYGPRTIDPTIKYFRHHLPLPLKKIKNASFARKKNNISYTQLLKKVRQKCIHFKWWYLKSKQPKSPIPHPWSMEKAFTILKLKLSMIVSL